MKILAALALAVSLALPSAPSAAEVVYPDGCVLASAPALSVAVVSPYTVIVFSTELNQYTTLQCSDYNIPGAVTWYPSYGQASVVCYQLNRYYRLHPHWRGPAPYDFYRPIVAAHPRFIQERVRVEHGRR